jgi:hypothetical protein
VQPEVGQQQFQAAQHDAASDADERAQRKGQPTRRLAPGRVDQAEFTIRQQDTGRDPGLPEQPFETLVGCRFPPTDGATLIRIDALTLQLHQQLPSSRPFRCGHRPVGDEPRRLFGQCHR